MIAWPALTSRDPFLWSTRSLPLRTMVNSSNAGVWPGSSHPSGLRMWATLAAEVFVLTRPIYSSINLGLLPADEIRVGCGIKVGIGLDFQNYVRQFEIVFISQHKSVTRRRDQRELSTR